MSETKKKRRLLPLLLLLIVIGGAASGGFVLGMRNAPPAEEEVHEGEVVEVGILTVSLGGAGTQYARVGLAMVLADGYGADEVSGRFPLVKDAAISVLAGKDPDDFRTQAGLARLREELSDIARDIYPDGEVLRVVLTEALVG